LNTISSPAGDYGVIYVFLSLTVKNYLLEVFQPLCPDPEDDENASY